MKYTVTAMALALSATAVFAEDKVTIEFAYPYSHLFDVTYEAMMPGFKEARDLPLAIVGRLKRGRNTLAHVEQISCDFCAVQQCV